MCLSQPQQRHVTPPPGPSHKRTKSGESSPGGMCPRSPEYKEGSEARSRLFRPELPLLSFVPGKFCFLSKKLKQRVQVPSAAQTVFCQTPSARHLQGEMREDEGGRGHSGHSGCRHFWGTPKEALAHRLAQRPAVSSGLWEGKYLNRKQLPG